MMRVIQVLILAIGMAIVWLFLVVPPAQLLSEPQSVLAEFGVGYVAGLIVLLSFQNRVSGNEPFKLWLLPQQIIYTIWYIITLSWDVLRSGIAVAWLVIQPTIDVDSETFEIHTGDTEQNSLVSAISAYSITITPGEMVIDFGRDANDEFTEQVMIVHVLNTKKSNQQTLEQDQAGRLKRIKRMLAVK